MHGHPRCAGTTKSSPTREQVGPALALIFQPLQYQRSRCSRTRTVVSFIALANSSYPKPHLPFGFDSSSTRSGGLFGLGSSL